ncbi:hypothetical protein CFI03_016690 [Paenibacillus sp. ATY16]|nr:hypothetical protein [Paenibacillus sp. ATY16]
MFSIKVHTSSHLQANQVFAVIMMKGSMFSPKYNELSLQEGRYEIISKAKFRIKKEGKDFEFEIESKPFKIDVY